MKITKQKRKIQSQTPIPSGTSTRDINIEDAGRHTYEISEKLASELKKLMHEATEEIRAEIISQV